MEMPLRCCPTMLSDVAHSLCACSVRLFLWHRGRDVGGSLRRDIENEDADTAARREAYEELGVDLPSLESVRESPLSSCCSRSSRPMSIKDGSPTESH